MRMPTRHCGTRSDCTLSKRAIKILDMRLRVIWVKIDRLVGSNDPARVYSVFEEPTDSVRSLFSLTGATLPFRGC